MEFFDLTIAAPPKVTQKGGSPEKDLLSRLYSEAHLSNANGGTTLWSLNDTHCSVELISDTNGMNKKQVKRLELKNDKWKKVVRKVA